MWFILFSLINSFAIGAQYPSPLRYWQTGAFSGTPEYTPVGVFPDRAVTFRQNDGVTNPPDFLMIESNSFGTSAINDSYQQWTVYGTQLTYCGLLTQNNGKSYQVTRPQFEYQPQLSSEHEVYFCANPRGGGCDTFWWQWKYYNVSGKMSWNSTLSGVPHELTYFDFVSAHSEDTNQPLHREMCVYALGVQMPYNYGWIDNPFLLNKTESFNAKNREEFKKGVPHYQQHYEHRCNYKH